MCYECVCVCDVCVMNVCVCDVCVMNVCGVCIIVCVTSEPFLMFLRGEAFAHVMDGCT